MKNAQLPMPPLRQVVQKVFDARGIVANLHSHLRTADRWNMRCTLIPLFTIHHFILDPEQWK
jgi:hypothetical protein